MLRLEYLPLPAAGNRLDQSPQDLLGILGFSDLPANAVPTLPRARIAMHTAGPEASPLCELWTSRAPVQHAAKGRICYATSGDLLFGVLASSVESAPIEERTRGIYAEIFALLEGLGHRHVLRFWNYVPRINEEEGGIERYRLFNMGRHAAFVAAGALRAETIPAASALGTGGNDDLTVYFMASRHPGLQIENPRQVHAWKYPPEHGPKSPMFARAAAYPGDAPTLLFVSGTASIVGHETQHVGDVMAQTRETLANLEAVFTQANRFGRFPIRDAAFKAYVRNAEDLATIKAEVTACLGSNANVTYLEADICRADLLVEIEAFAQAE